MSTPTTKEVLIMFSEGFKYQRKRTGYTREEIEKLLSLKKGTVKKWEEGKKEPSLTTLALLSNFFLCSTDTLLKKE